MSSAPFSVRSAAAPIRRWRWPLSRLGIGGRLVALHLLILCVLTALLTAIEVGHLSRQARTELGERALNASRLVAQFPAVIECARRGEQNPALNAFVNALRRDVGADYIVVGERHGIRLAHPTPDRLGRPMEGGDNEGPLSGDEIISVARGSLGLAVRGKVPIFSGHEIVGVVSTGFLMPQVRALAQQAFLELLPWFVLALAFGTLGAVLIARRLRREILGLEPEQIAALVQEHQAVLSALGEGVLALGPGGEITLASARAEAALKLRGQRPQLAEVWPAAAQLTPARRHNLELALNDLSVLVNTEPLPSGGQVLTFRERSEALRLAEELTQVRSLVDVLRAQGHEYANHLHVISGLLQLGHVDEAREALHQQIEADADFRELTRELQVPRVAALLFGQRERAQELGVTFKVEGESNLSRRWERHSGALVTILGNLIQNAFEALEGRAGEVTVSIGEDPDGLQIEVQDSGPGLDAAVQQQIFERGVSGKGEGRGHGLANVRARVDELGGQVRVFRRGKATVFQVSAPPVDPA
ncbi:sensor histidine kinase [Deinococcus irradiatisoli]|uniref:histidine kinase n=1 Tax=Deinococcus irradiatisoli TaxID=2202254 RepID=A0A2Z3J9T8_9DEIO|nr:sensor histidine kinase [Deinococcus irradiatisoli]AWN21843.1 sensor histidine kinase [Deinococcus irradiatisoli]